MKQILHVQGVNSVLSVVLYDGVGYEDWFVSIWHPKLVHSETTRQASY